MRHLVPATIFRGIALHESRGLDALVSRDRMGLDCCSVRSPAPNAAHSCGDRYGLIWSSEILRARLLSGHRLTGSDDKATADPSAALIALQSTPLRMTVCGGRSGSITGTRKLQEQMESFVPLGTTTTQGYEMCSDGGGFRAFPGLKIETWGTLFARR